MSIVSTSITSCAYITEVITIASSDTIGDAVYYLFMSDHCFITLAYVLSLILPFPFMPETSGILDYPPCPSCLFF